MDGSRLDSLSTEQRELRCSLMCSISPTGVMNMCIPGYKGYRM
jgi:hypothetical protein